jgi:hypothetical protein
MRVYSVKCASCSFVFDVKLSPANYKSLKTDGVPCVVCHEGSALLFFDPSLASISFKGDVWSDKNHRELEYREARSASLAVKQKESHFVPKLQPNVNGEVVDSWSEAKKLADSQGKLSTTYDSYVKGS